MIHNIIKDIEKALKKITKLNDKVIFNLTGTKLVFRFSSSEYNTLLLFTEKAGKITYIHIPKDIWPKLKYE